MTWRPKPIQIECGRVVTLEDTWAVECAGEATRKDIWAFEYAEEAHERILLDLQVVRYVTSDVQINDAQESKCYEVVCVWHKIMPTDNICANWTFKYHMVV